MSSKKDLNSEQVTMLVEVVKRSQSNLTMQDWSEIATLVGSTNARAAKERFRYLMNMLKNTDRDDGADAKAPKTPKTPKTPRKRAANGVKKKSAKKAKVKSEAEDESGDQFAEDDHASDEPGLKKEVREVNDDSAEDDEMA